MYDLQLIKCPSKLIQTVLSADFLHLRQQVVFLVMLIIVNKLTNQRHALIVTFHIRGMVSECVLCVLTTLQEPATFTHSVLVNVLRFKLDTERLSIVFVSEEEKYSLLCKASDRFT